MDVIWLILGFFRVFILPRTALAAENLALRQQLGVLQRSVKRPRMRKRDRILWVWLSRLWADWRSSFLIVRPEIDNDFGLWPNCGVTAFNMCNMVNILRGAKSR